MWMPLAPLPDGTGGLTFVTASHRRGCLPDGPGDPEGNGSAEPRYTYRDLLPGNATFHLGTVLHAGPGNPSRTAVREVITVIYFVDGTRTLPPRRREHEAEFRIGCPAWPPASRPSHR
jgi:ectoine hydroxylase-related dioxygenase (phytanoyl-CoA dioxygenase family)